MEAKLTMDRTVRTRHVAVAMEPTLMPERWGGSKPRMAESATVSFTYTHVDAVHDHSIGVEVQGRYVLKSGDLGSQKWSRYVWRSADPDLYNSLVAVARAVL